MRIIRSSSHHPPTSRTRYYRISPEDSQWLCDHILALLVHASERSCQGDRDPWLAMVTPDRSLWGTSRLYPGDNTMLSVLSGLYQRLSRGLDLSQKQLDMINRIGSVVDQLALDSRLESWTIQDCP